MSKNEENLLSFYSSILSLGKMGVDENGFVYLDNSDNKLPVTVKLNGRADRLVLPTVTNLHNSDKGNFIFFHPLRENAVRGESEIISFFRKMINLKVIATLSILIEQILTLGTTPEYQTKLTSDQAVLLSVIKDADGKTLDFWNKIVHKISYDKTSTRPVSIYLRKHGSLKGTKYFCLGICTFPLYEGLSKAELDGSKEFLGIKCRAKDIAIISSLMREIIPNIGNPDDYYRAGSNDKNSSHLCALLKTTLLMAKPLNKITELLYKGRSYLPKVEKDEMYAKLYFITSWENTLDNLDKLEKEILLIPMQPGNEGSVSKTKEAVDSNLNKSNEIGVSNTEDVIFSNNMDKDVDSDIVSKPAEPRKFETINEPVNNQQILNQNQGYNNQVNGNHVRDVTDILPNYGNQNQQYPQQAYGQPPYNQNYYPNDPYQNQNNFNQYNQNNGYQNNNNWLTGRNNPYQNANQNFQPNTRATPYNGTVDFNNGYYYNQNNGFNRR